MILKSLFVLVIGASGVCAQGQGKTYSCEGKGTAQLDSRNQSSTMKAWMKGTGRLRMEETANNRTAITIVDGIHIWLLSVKEKKGVHRLRTAQEVSATADKRAIGDDLGGFLKQGAKLNGKESVDGVLCDLYELKKNDLTHRLWVIPGPDRFTKKRHSFGVSTFATGPGAPMQKHRMSRQVTYNWKSNVPVPDSLFKVPPGYKIQETQAAPPPVFAPPKGK